MCRLQQGALVRVGKVNSEEAPQHILIHNDIVKQFRVRIIRYAERFQEMHDLEKYLPPSFMKSKSFDEARWKFRGKELSEHVIRVHIRDVLHSSMHDEWEYNQ